MSFYDRYSELCKRIGKDETPVAIEMGFSNATSSYWKKSGCMPSKKTVKIVADYFGVSVDYFREIKNEVGEVVDSKYRRIVPIYESVSAGLGINAEDYVIGYTPATIRSDKEASETIAIKVKGDSMYPRIMDGDIILVHKQPTAENKETAVVRIDDSYVVKQFIKESDRIVLHSHNPEYMDREFVGEDMNRVEIIGVVTSLQRYKP